MKTRIACFATLATALLLTVGCAGTKTASTSEKGAGIASSEQLDPNLPLVAAPPAASWGGRPYSY